MITLKYWNSLSSQCRVNILRRILGTDHFVDTLSEEYHHNFDYDATGKELKSILSSCYLRRVYNNSYIEVRCSVDPTFKSKESNSSITDKPNKSDKTNLTNRTNKSDKPDKTPSKDQQLSSPYTYYFRMYTEQDPEDGENIWEEAYSEQEARDKAYHDFHSIVSLDLIGKKTI